MRVRIAVALSVLSSFAAAAASIQLDKAPIILGQTDSVAATITIDEPEDADVRPLRLAVNVGSFSPVQRLGPGKYRAIYSPPSTKFPQVALVAVWRETGPEAPIEFLRIALHGSTKIPVGARKGSKVWVTLGDTTFGPHVVDADRQVEVPIIVPPGVLEAELKVREPNGNSLTKKLPVDVPGYNRVTAGLVPHAIVADGQAQARLDIFYDKADPTMKAGRVKVACSSGNVTFERASDGRFVYWYRPPAGLAAGTVEFTVSIDGDARAKATARLQLGMPPPARVVVRPPLKTLRADGKSSEPVQLIVLDKEGLGLPDQAVSLTANGAEVKGFHYRGNGVYEAAYVAPADFPPGGLVQFEGVLAARDGNKLTGVANYVVSATAMPREATFRLTPSPVPADGRTPARMELDVRDEAGLPLPGAHLVVVASHGTLGPLEEAGEGRYLADFTAPAAVPDGDTLVRVVDTSGAFERKFALPMRENPHRLLVGLRGSVVHSLGDLVGPRGGVDVSVPLRVGPLYLYLSALASIGQATQTVSDASGNLTTASQLLFVPMALRASLELLATRRLGLQVGGGGGVTWARYSTTLTQQHSTAWGPSGLAFVAGTAAVGPGHFFAEVGYTYAPVAGPGFRAETGGLSLTVGYRLGVL